LADHQSERTPRWPILPLQRSLLQLFSQRAVEVQWLLRSTVGAFRLLPGIPLQLPLRALL
jgi:hypothetical protein